ncbi:transcriptional regulator [Pseudoduganella sp. FT26W]|jgi:DNA-binding PadR family transcriptional regulator|uniref:Transcriptional regulator n=2 Tax=Duganella TaxID=75654 RepID=A0A6L5QM50_9BURK|nr:MULTISPECIES: transcriptional regulator [Duganella]MRW84265.1 transcriptional regulator [Duganella aquatilis]MRX10856.1 transcriptional regulator [Duganella alba]MRX16548.1 transcriptional regulator [Duganella alba]
MDGLDEVIHQSTRLRMMTALHTLKKDEWIEFVRLKSLVNASDGNLGAHLETLARAGYVEIDKQIVGKKPLTRIRTTPAGRAAYRHHVAQLRALLDM